MEGELWKWTNYWNGWQSRWFILEDGILSYYKSYDEVSQGCKGSLNISACEIIVNSSDHTRLDLIISGGEQYMYLRASNEKERQRWLIALGSAKTCINNRPRHRLSSTSSVASNIAISEISEDSTSLKTKKSELRLYCDLLMQQALLVKDSIQEDGKVDKSRLEEGTSLLPQTCDMFIRTLDEVMRLSDANFVYTLSTARVGDPAAESAMLHHHHQPHHTGNGNSRKNSRSSVSQKRSITPVGSSSRRRRPSNDSVVSRISPTLQEEDEPSGVLSSSRATSQEKDYAAMSSSPNPSSGFRSVFGFNQTHSESPAVVGFSPESSPDKYFQGPDHSQVETGEEAHFDFFPLKPKFPHPFNSSIPTETFLNAAQGALRIYDFLSTPNFSVIRRNAENQILPIRTKFSTDTKKFENLDSLLPDELGLDHDHRAVANALTGLTQHLMYIHNFLRRFLESDEDEVSKCLLEAFQSTTEQQDAHIDNATYQAAMNLQLSRSNFLQNFGISPSHHQKSSSVDRKLALIHQTKLFPPLADYLDSMELCLMTVVKMSKDHQQQLRLKNSQELS